MVSSVDICNRALAQIAEIPSAQPISSLSPPAGDSLAAANACSILYNPIYLAVLRQYEWDFARLTASLVAWGPEFVAPAMWPYAYFYPSDCIQLRQVLPTTLADPYDPQPVRHAVAETGSATGSTKLILTTVSPAYAVYTADIADPTMWDWAFAEAMVRALASALALTLAGRPDFSREKLTEAAQFESIAESRRS